VRSDGYWHAAITVALSAPVGLATGLLTGSPIAAVVAGLGCLAGVLVSPDLDQQGIAGGELVLLRLPKSSWMTALWITHRLTQIDLWIFSPVVLLGGAVIAVVAGLIAAVFVGTWLPYSMLFKHRGISHWPLVGTLTRLIYLGVVIVAFTLLLGHGVPRVPTEALYGVAGLAVADLGHLARDVWTSR
jgi:uncharacterized metal-binding protein